MDDVIERAARAMLIDRARRNFAARGITATDDMIGEPPESSMVVAREDVRAVLVALQTPTHSMLSAGIRVGVDTFGAGYDDYEEIYKAMIGEPIKGWPPLKSKKPLIHRQ